MALVLAAVVGCDETSAPGEPAHGPVAPVTTVAPAVEAAAPTMAEDDAVAATTTAPAAVEATQPATSLMNINGHLTVFPPARLRLDSDGQNVVALLYSDDPREALRSNYTGNSFYLRMVLDIEDPANLADAQWNYAAPSGGERETDSPYGIFLGGRKIALQPFNVSARFKTEGETTVALLMGTFKILDDTPGHGPAQVLPVSAELPLHIDAQP